MKFLVSLLNYRTPVTELSNKTKYSKGAVSNYLSGRQNVSKKFYDCTISHTSNDIGSFELKKRLASTITNFTNGNNIDLNKFIISAGIDSIIKNTDDLEVSILQLKSKDILQIIDRIAFTIPNITDYVEDVQSTIPSNISQDIQEEVNADLTDSEIFELVQKIRANRTILLKDELFLKLLNSMAYTAEIEKELRKIKEDIESTK